MRRLRRRAATTENDGQRKKRGAILGFATGRLELTESLSNGLAALRVAAVVALLVAGLALAPAARAQDPEYLIFGAGVFDMNDDDTAPMISIEFIDDRKWLWEFKPMTGFFLNFDGGMYAYAGLALDVHLGPRFVLTPSLAPGLYFEGDSKDLGHVIEFRSSIKASWQFDDSSRFGVDLSHISNAGLGSRNPGANQLMMIYSRPLGSIGK
jgi:hypothetical protein